MKLSIVKTHWPEDKRRLQIARLRKLWSKRRPGSVYRLVDFIVKQRGTVPKSSRPAHNTSRQVLEEVALLFRAAAAVGIDALELSARDIAKLVGRAKATIESALRWFELAGVTTAQLRKGYAIVSQGGREFERGIFRTSLRRLTSRARALLRVDTKPATAAPPPPYPALAAPPEPSPEPPSAPVDVGKWLAQIQQAIE